MSGSASSLAWRFRCYALPSRRFAHARSVRMPSSRSFLYRPCGAAGNAIARWLAAQCCAAATARRGSKRVMTFSSIGSRWRFAMCEDCGCGDSELVPVAIHERILADNDARAAHLREHFVEAGVLAINLMGSPGAGKTAVLEQTARLAGPHLRLGAVSGDLATDRDA